MRSSSTWRRSTPRPPRWWRTCPTGSRRPCCSSRSPSCRSAPLWVAMVQREVGERLAAAPGSKAYGATSVLAQLACEVRVLRRVPRTVFHPEPNVESALVLLRRRAAAPPPELTALVHSAFAHRRKALAGSLALMPGAADDLRAAARAALDGDRPSRRRPGGAARPRGLAAPCGRHRSRATGPAASMTAAMSPSPVARARLREAQPRPPRRPRPRADGLHPLCSIFASIDLRDDVVVEPARLGQRRRRMPRRRRPQPRRGRPGRLPRARPRAAAVHVRIEKLIPIAAGLGGGSADAAAVLRAANRIVGRPARRRRPARAGAPSWARTSPARSSRATRWSAGWARSSSRSTLPPYAAVLVPQDEGLVGRGRVRAVRPHGRRARRLELERLRELARDMILAPALNNDLQPAALALRPELADGARLPARRGRARRARERLGPRPASALFADRGRRRRPPRHDRRTRSSPSCGLT